jgi:hypothetical protein
MGGLVSAGERVMVTWTAATQEMKVEIGRLADSGLSASKIGAIVGRTREAICGLAFRNPDIIKLKGPSGFHRNPRTRMPRKRKPAPVGSQPVMRCQPLPPEPEILEDCQPITLLELTEVTCHWPIGSHDYTFCGRTISSGQTFCRPHAALAYRPRS